MKCSLSILLSVLILIMNMSMTLTTHYCGGKAVKSLLSFGNDQLDCGINDMDSQVCLDNQQNEKIHKKKCCENKFTSLSIQKSYHKSDITLSALDVKFIATFIVVYIYNYFFRKDSKKSFLVYLSPFIQQDRSVLFQVFRI